MKITDIEVFFLRCPMIEPRPRPTASFVFDGSMVLRVHTDEGITGLGEPSPYGAPLGAMKRLFETEIRQRFICKNPFDVQLLTIQAERSGGSGYGKVPYNAAIAGLSHALWDIVGKALGTPVYKLINKKGDYRDKVRVYASGGMSLDSEDPSVVVEEAIACKQQGYTAWKMRPCTTSVSSHLKRQATPPPLDIKRFISTAQRVRSAVGTDMDLLADLGCRCESVTQAIEVCTQLQECNFFLVEEPLPRKPDDYALLAKKVDVPIAGGECLINRRQFAPWLDCQAYGIIQPDGNMAGITELIEIAGIAETKGIPCVIHNWANAISIAANLHLASAVSNCSMVEFSVTYNPLRTELIKNPLAPQNGYISMPDRPGLGIELNEETLKKYQFTP